jgi:AcrR family transcriptional regulator
MAKARPTREDAPVPVRRTQADRSASTRATLEDATIDLLVERGWAAVTAVEVCTRAGVTRGAFHHHYPDLPTLLAAALRRLYDEARGEDRPHVADLEGLVDATWASISGPRFKAVLEAWLAMANDPGLRQEIGPVVAEFATLVSPEQLAPKLLADEDDRARYVMAREALLGLALGRATNGGRPLGHEDVVLAQLRAAVGRPATD